MTEPHGHKRAGVEGTEEIPNQILTVMGTHLVAWTDKPKEGIGGALSLLLVSLLLHGRLT